MDEARAARVANARSRFPGSLVDQFVSGSLVGDPPADELVRELMARGNGQGWRMLDAALVGQHVCDAPPALTRMLSPLLSPRDVDFAQVERGAVLWWRFLPANVIGLSGALLMGYAHGDLVKPMAWNGRALELAGRRYEETARWMYSATEPGNLEPGRAGFRDTIMIRMLHAVVRQRMRARADWDHAAWGEPIHRSGMCLTNLSFYQLPRLVSERLGMTFRDDELEAMGALWRWVGTLMGLPEAFLPSSPAWAQAFGSVGRAILAPPDEDSHTLTRAALQNAVRAERALPERMWERAAPWLRPIASRLVYGTSHRMLQQLERPPGLALSALRLLVRQRERARERGWLGSEREIARRQRALYLRSLERIRAAPRALDPHHA